MSPRTETKPTDPESKKAAFKFTSVSESDFLPYTAFRLPALNENGLVAFEAFFAIAAPPSAILRGGGAQIVPIVDARSGLDTTFISSINSRGTVSFTGNIFGETMDDPLVSSGIYIGNGRGIKTIADRSTSSGQFGNFLFYGGSSINDAGTIAFLGITEFFETGIFTISGGNVETIASRSGEFASFEKQISTIGGDRPITGVYSFPSLNNQGTVFFTASLDNGKRGIFAGDADEVLTVVDSTRKFDLFSSPSSNDKGQVAFLAKLDNGEAGIYISDRDGVTKAVAKSTGFFNEFSSDPALNNKGQVAFQATLDDGTEGIFIGSNPVTDKVIAVGDALAGSRVAELLFTGREAFNARGQIAFTAILENGTDAIFRADPVCGTVHKLAGQLTVV